MDQAEIRKRRADIDAALADLQVQHSHALAASDVEEEIQVQQKMSDLLQQKEDLQAKLSA
jgi:hypothetical protein